MMHYRPETIRFSLEDTDKAAAMLLKGGLVALPTETVYGLAASAEDGPALLMLYEVKKRDPDKASAVLVTGMEMVEKYCQNIPQGAYRLAEKYWPGPLTMILEDKGVVYPATTGEGDTLGVRCPNHPVTLAVIEKAGVALAAPSANPAGQPSPKTAQEVLDYFDGHMEGIIDGGPCALGVESTIVDLTGEEPAILREGAIPAQEILAVLREG